MKSTRMEFIPETFIGKGGKGYILKEMVVHRGRGAPIVNRKFKDVIRLVGTQHEH